jgi:hypothetical protein
MSNLALRWASENLRTLAFGSISGTFTGIGASFLNPIRQLYIVNTTDVLLTFSDDGVNAKFVIPAGSYILLDITSNKAEPGGNLSISQGSRIYVEGAPTLGAVYLSAFYASGVLS